MIRHLLANTVSDEANVITEYKNVLKQSRISIRELEETNQLLRLLRAFRTVADRTNLYRDFRAVYELKAKVEVALDKLADQYRLHEATVKKLEVVKGRFHGG